MRRVHGLLVIGLVLLIQVCVDVVSIELPIRYVPPPTRMVTRAFGTDGVSPGYEYLGGSWGVALNVGSSAGPIYCNLDTGSFDLFISGQNCVNCLPTPPTYYQASGSQQIVACSSTTCTAARPRTSCNGANCQTTVVYGDKSSVTATVVRDAVGLDGLSTRIIGYFGSITSTQNSENNVTFLSRGQGGLIGCAYGTGSSFPNGAGQNLFDYIANVNNQPNIFSLCLNRDDPWMSFGENYYGKPSFFWVPVNYKPYYGFTLNNILLNYQSTTANGGGVSLGLSQVEYNDGRPFIDSGTTLIYFKNNVFNAFYDSLLEACRSGVNLVGVCNIQNSNTSIFFRSYPLTAAQVAVYPTIQLAVSCVGTGAPCVTLNIPPTSWIRLVSSGYIAGVQSRNDFTILGSLFMQNFHVVFDKTRDYIGFAPQTTCNLDGVVTNVTKPSSNPNPGSRLKTPFSLLREMIQN